MAMWYPQHGFQTDVINCRGLVDELAILGNRAGGKTTALLMDFAYDVEEFGKHWRGVIFRRESTEFRTLIDRSKEMFYDMWGTGGYVSYLEDPMLWRWNNGATLQFVHMYRDSDVESFVGQELAYIGWDEAPQMPTSTPYRKILGSLRSSGNLHYKDSDKSPCRVRLTGNPGGVGIGWIKHRFRIPDEQKEVEEHSCRPFVDERSGLTRMFLLSLYEENEIFQKKNPSYFGRLLASTEGDDELEKAWIKADFSSLFGQYFKQFKAATHKVDPLEVFPNGKVPHSWRVEGSFDYGMGSAATSFGLWAKSAEKDPLANEILKSKGIELEVEETPVVSVRLSEYYDYTESPSQAAGGINDCVDGCPYTGGRKPRTVWCDSSIFSTPAATQQGDPNRFVAPYLARMTGLRFRPATKDRKSGWAAVKEGLNVKQPTLYYTDDCPDFEREMKDAVYSKEINRRWDIDKESSDDALDETRYYVMGSRKGNIMTMKKKPRGYTMDDLLRRARRQRKGIPYRHEAPMVQVQEVT